jgi:hypothetical protein
MQAPKGFAFGKQEARIVEGSTYGHLFTRGLRTRARRRPATSPLHGSADLHLTGKTALVTGGSAGIGLACARALIDEGVDVAIRRTRRRASGASGDGDHVADAGRRVLPISRIPFKLAPSNSSLKYRS